MRFLYTRGISCFSPQVSILAFELLENNVLVIPYIVYDGSNMFICKRTRVIKMLFLKKPHYIHLTRMKFIN